MLGSQRDAIAEAIRLNYEKHINNEDHAAIVVNLMEDIAEALKDNSKSFKHALFLHLCGHPKHTPDRVL